MKLKEAEAFGGVIKALVLLDRALVRPPLASGVKKDKLKMELEVTFILYYSDKRNGEPV